MFSDVPSERRAEIVHRSRFFGQYERDCTRSRHFSLRGVREPYQRANPRRTETKDKPVNADALEWPANLERFDATADACALCGDDHRGDADPTRARQHFVMARAELLRAVGQRLP
jgi:hypothetical protein